VLEVVDVVVLEMFDVDTAPGVVARVTGVEVADGTSMIEESILLRLDAFGSALKSMSKNLAVDAISTVGVCGRWMNQEKKD
jgi:hypothetical protein